MLYYHIKFKCFQTMNYFLLFFVLWIVKECEIAFYYAGSKTIEIQKCIFELPVTVHNLIIIFSFSVASDKCVHSRFHQLHFCIYHNGTECIALNSTLDPLLVPGFHQ